MPTTPAGYQALLAWLSSYGPLGRVGVEGHRLLRHRTDPASCAPPASRWWKGPPRPPSPPHPRQVRPAGCLLPTTRTARAAQAGTAAGLPKTSDGSIEAIRALRVTRSGAVRARTQATNALKSLLVTAPAHLREQLRGQSTAALVATCAKLRPSIDVSRPERPRAGHQDRAAPPGSSPPAPQPEVGQEVTEADAELSALVTVAAPQLLELAGVGTEVAAQLLITAGDNPDRLTSGAAFAHLCGVAPVPASSGRTHRHRPKRGSDRGANNALYVVVLGRLRFHEPTCAYALRRTRDGLSKPEIIRCLKRFVAREIYRALRPRPLVDDLRQAA